MKKIWRNLGEAELTWIESRLGGRAHRVVISGTKLSLKPVTSSVPQWSILGQNNLISSSTLTAQGAMGTNRCKKFCWNIWKRFFPVRLTVHWHRLLGGCGVTILRHTQKPPGIAPQQLLLDRSAWDGGWIRWFQRSLLTSPFCDSMNYKNLSPNITTTSTRISIRNGNEWKAITWLLKDIK